MHIRGRRHLALHAVHHAPHPRSARHTRHTRTRGAPLRLAGERSLGPRPCACVRQ